MSGWRQITCQEREDLVTRLGRSYNGFSAESGIGVLASKTDIDGEYGTPEIYTEWGRKATDEPVLRDYRWPNSDRPCEHYVPEGSTS
jgi:hypothetical protein